MGKASDSLWNQTCVGLWCDDHKFRRLVPLGYVPQGPYYLNPAETVWRLAAGRSKPLRYFSCHSALVALLEVATSPPWVQIPWKRSTKPPASIQGRATSGDTVIFLALSSVGVVGGFLQLLVSQLPNRPLVCPQFLFYFLNQISELSSLFATLHFPGNTMTEIVKVQPGIIFVPNCLYSTD